jgi:hypothetical protein
MLGHMATRKPVTKRPGTAAARKAAAKSPRTSAAVKSADGKRVASKSASSKKARPASKAAGNSASKSGGRKQPVQASRPAVRKKPASATHPVRQARPTEKAIATSVATPPAEAPKRRRMSASERNRTFNQLLQAACMKAGTAAAISTISSKVPFLGRLTPLVLGSVGETLALAKVQQQLVRDTMALYDLELSDAEERGVILLATAVNIGAQQISKATVEQLIEQISGRLYRPVISHILPLASVATEVAASVASTYAVGKRAQALCQLPGTGARDLGEWLRNMSGIDQARLFKWTGDAFALALKPFRGVLTAMVPGLSLVTGKRR